MANEEISFGRFRLDLGRPELRCDGQPVRIHRRALGILCALAEAKGEIVSRDELMSRLWPGRVVEEANLHVHVSALRKSLGEHGEGHSLVVTVPGRGYRLADLTGLQSALLAEGSLPPQLSLPDKPSIAVMPFANLSVDPDQEYFADGMVEEIITALSRIRWLFVIARTSTFSYKGRSPDLKQVGRELGVRYVLEGSVRKGAGRLRISAQLIDAESGVHLWADHFDGTLDDIFDIQDRVASSVAGIIEPTLRSAEVDRVRSRSTKDLTAYDLFLHALPYWRMATEKASWRALELLNEAIERDPLFAPARALSAFCHQQLYISGWAHNPEQSRLDGIQSARAALRISNDDPVVLGLAAYTLGAAGEDIVEVLELIERSLRLNPSSAESWRWSGWLRLWSGDPDLAISHFESALRLNPRDGHPGILMGIGVCHFFSCRFQAAIELLIRSLQLHSSWVPTFRFLAASYWHLGQIEDARNVIRQLKNLTNIIIPPVEHWRKPEYQDLLLSGLRPLL